MSWCLGIEPSTPAPRANRSPACRPPVLLLPGPVAARAARGVKAALGRLGIASACLQAWRTFAVLSRVCVARAGPIESIHLLRMDPMGIKGSLPGRSYCLSSLYPRPTCSHACCVPPRRPLNWPTNMEPYRDFRGKRLLRHRLLSATCTFLRTLPVLCTYTPTHSNNSAPDAFSECTRPPAQLCGHHTRVKAPKTRFGEIMERRAIEIWAEEI